jgi:hypothetical protein
MVFRLDDTARPVTRQDLADPHRGRTLHDRLTEVGGTDLRDNAHFVEYGGGYGTLLPVDPAKTFAANVTGPNATEAGRRVKRAKGGDGPGAAGATLKGQAGKHTKFDR